MPAAPVRSSPRERLLFDADWRFSRHDPADAGDALGYDKIRPWVLATGVELIGPGTVPAARPQRPPGNPGGDVSHAQRECNDSAWRRLDLPHDWGVEGPFDQALPGETGKLPWVGVGWYRKKFALPARDSGRRIYLDFDGAMAYSAIWINGQFAGGWPYGYSSFRIDVTPFVEFGTENTVAVRLENPPWSSRWYPGSGLYRHVWLVKAPPVAIAHWGVFVTTPQVTRSAATVNIDVTVENLTNENASLALTTSIHAVNADGTRAARAVARSAADEFAINLAHGREVARANLAVVRRPRLWDLARRHRYVAVTTLWQDGRVIDEVETPFGIRTIAFKADDGFHLNGRRVQLQGVCMHHDLGALGAALNERALERQLERLQEMGCNALRTSHNPPAPELLALCDRLGLLVMDEAFDCWRRGKKWAPELAESDPGFRFSDYARVFDDWHERDLRALIRRDRNHPCIVLWSIGNELPEQWLPDGWKLAAHLAGLVREEDRSRPITAGFNNDESGFNGFQTALDVAGFNYRGWIFPRFHALHPTIPVHGSETSSCVSTRGDYQFPVSDDKLTGRGNFQMSSYDLYAPPWANTPDQEFRWLDENPHACGEFVWTGFDYLGEPTPFNDDASNLLNYSDPVARARAAGEIAAMGKSAVPSRSSYFGIIDLAGFSKDRFHLYQAHWRPELRMAHILPHWNWPERVGQVTPVHVYSSGDEAELFLNGRSLGRRKRQRFQYRFRWDDVVYEPGELRVVTWKRGRRWATAVRCTTGAAVQLTLTADRPQPAADGRDLVFVTIAVNDQAGLTVPTADHLVQLAVAGPADLLAVDNGDATSHASFQAHEIRAFHGLALAIIRPRAGRGGRITVRASAGGLTAATVTLHSR